jgi:hypothetical protein
VVRKAALVALLATRASAEAPSGPSAGLPRDDSVAVQAPSSALPTGVEVGSVERPSQVVPTYCSALRPVCVHDLQSDPERALDALSALERAYERLAFGLELPAPRPDGGLGGSDALDAYLMGASESLHVDADPPAEGTFARSSGFCRFPSADAELLRRSATLCVGEALALNLDASEPPHLRRAFATWLWWMTGDPTSLDLEAIDEVQRHPERPIAARELGTSSEGSAIFFEFLEASLGVRGFAELGASLVAAAASPRPSGLDHDNEPDLFDVLRHTLDSNRFRFARLLGDFSVARAFLGDREDGEHLPRLAWAGAFGRARFDWVIPFSSLPRRVAVKPAIDSTGSVLIWLDLDRVPEKVALGFQAEWESPVSFDWQLVRMGPHGEELGRVPVPFEERGTSTEATIGHLGGTAAILAIGTNLETVELAHPFDPDVAPFEPHGVTVYFAKL